MYVYSKITSGFDKNRNLVKRSYTPISRVNQRGCVTFLIKVYHPTERFPEGGILTQYLSNLHIGDTITMDGPKGKVRYLGKGVFYFKKTEKKKKFNKISMIAGGTGIAPCYQLIIHMLEEKDQKYDLRLLFGNRTKNDILLKDELDTLRDNNHLKVTYTVDKGDPGWKGLTGFIDKSMIENAFCQPSEDHLVFYCGPKPMNKEIKIILFELGFDESNTFKF